MRLSHTRGCVLVAGGGSALGTASATLLARAGVPLCLTAGSAEAAARIHNAFSAAHLSCPPVLIVRMEDTARADALPEQAAAAAGMPAAYLLDLMHYDHESLLASASPDTISAYIEANITWRARLVRAVSRHMLHRRCGRMVFVSSTAAALPAAGQGPVCRGKTGCRSPVPQHRYRTGRTGHHNMLAASRICGCRTRSPLSEAASGPAAAHSAATGGGRARGCRSTGVPSQRRSRRHQRHRHHHGRRSDRLQIKGDHSMTQQTAPCAVTERSSASSRKFSIFRRTPSLRKPAYYAILKPNPSICSNSAWGSMRHSAYRAPTTRCFSPHCACTLKKPAMQMLTRTK